MRQSLGSWCLSGLRWLTAATLLATPCVIAAQEPAKPAQDPQKQEQQQQPPADQQPGDKPQAAGPAQDQANPAQPATGAADKDKDKGNGQGQSQGQGNANSSGTSNDRMFFALPNFLTIENTGPLKPLTTGQKFKAVARGAFDPVELGYFGVVAGISQAANSEPGYGQGAQGYAKRYGATFGDSTIENFMVGAVMPSLLRTDPRYYQMGKGGFARRFTYAISRLFVARTDSGHATFNFSEVFGGGMAAAISTYSYHPKGDRTASNTASVWGTQVAQDAFTYTLKEFWPDIRKKFKKK